jgi:hypothetical protein
LELGKQSFLSRIAKRALRDQESLCHQLELVKVDRPTSSERRLRIVSGALHPR